MFEFDNLKDVNIFKDGEYVFKSPKNFSIKFLNFDESSSSHILVCFNAAISNRSEKIGPFYSGLGLAEKLKIPTIALSDFMVTNNNLSLGWYCGDEYNYDYQSSIASFLDRVSNFFDKKLIVLGGSGGGFASLAIASKLKCDATVITMNPQTALHKYFMNPVNEYLKLAFPSFQGITVEDCETCLDSVGIVNSVCNLEYPSNIKILYLQNKTDEHHVNRHFGPFITNKDLVPWGDNSYMNNDNVALYLGYWGGGHIPPSVDILKRIIESIKLEKPLVSILRDLENGMSGLNKNLKDTSVLTKHDYRIRVRASRDTGEVTVAFLHRGLKINAPANMQYAVYVLTTDSRTLYRSHYSKSIPKLPELIEPNVRIKVFVKDQFGRKIIGLSNRV